MNDRSAQVRECRRVGIRSGCGTPLLMNRIFSMIDWKEVREWLSPLIAFFSVCWAVHESRAKTREQRARVDDQRKYTEALETVIRYGHFVQHLEGVKGGIGDVTRQLSEIANQATIGVQAATSAIRNAVESLAAASEAAKEIAEQLNEIGKVALRAQRDSLHAHRDLLRAQPKLTDPTPPEEGGA